MKRRRINTKKIILFIIMLLLFGMFILSMIKIISYIIDNKNNKMIQEAIIEDSITIQEPDSIDDNQDIVYNIDFQSLKIKNPDTVAYLKVNNTNIDYIVVKGNDNSYYLNHNFYKKWNVSGWIFADYHNKFDGTDKNIVVFGHNTRDGSMFGSLKNVLNKDWYENSDNYEVLFVTESGTYYYQVFSTYISTSEDYYINTEFDSEEDFIKFTDIIKSRSIFDYGVVLSKNDKILTLSSCTSDGKKRVVLHAKLLDNYDYTH